MGAPDATHYVIRGGAAGRERLRVLSRVMRPTTMALFDRLEVQGGLHCLDVGCQRAFHLSRIAGLLRDHERYCATVRRRGGDPDIGPRLPGLLKKGGFERVGVAIVQQMAMEGETKIVSPLTMENIPGPVIADGLAPQAEIDGVFRELYDFTANPDTLAGTPRVVQAWGDRPAS